MRNLFALLLAVLLSIGVTAAQPVNPPSVTLVIPVRSACNGTGDDTPAITAAIALVPSGGATVALPAGVCMIASSISLPNNTMLLGAGRGASTIRMEASKNINPMLTNATVGGGLITVRSLSIDGNKTSNGAGTSQGVHFIQASNVTMQDVEVHHVNGPGISIDGNGVNTTTGDFITDVYTHDNDLQGFLVTFAQRQTMIKGLHSTNDGSTGNPTFDCVFLDASENMVNGIVVDKCNSNGIHIHNVFGGNYVNLTAARGRLHGIFVEEMNSSAGANWLAESNGLATANTYDDIHFGNGTVGYGITANSSITNLTVGAQAQYGTTQERYALYLEDNISNNVTLNGVTYVAAGTTGTIRTPATAYGTLAVFANTRQDLTAASGTITQLGTHLKLSGWGAGGPGGNGIACASAASCSGGAAGGGGGRFASGLLKWVDLGVASCTVVVGQPLANGAALTGGATTVTCGSYAFSAFAGGAGQNAASAAATGGGAGGNPCGSGASGTGGTGGAPGGNTCGGASGGSGGIGFGDVSGQGSGGAGTPNAGAGTTGGNEAVGGTTGGGSGGGCNAGAAAAGGNGGKTVLGQVAGSAIGVAGLQGLSASGFSGMGGSGGGSAITTTNGGGGGHGALPGGGGGGAGDTCNAGTGTIGTGGTSGGGEVIAEQ